MLNRRILRIKVMQAMFAFRRNQESNYHLAKEKLKELVHVEMLKEGMQEKPKYQAEQAESMIIFDDLVKKRSTEGSKDRFAGPALAHYEMANRKDIANAKSRMLNDVEQIETRYIEFLYILIRLAQFSLADEESKKKKFLANPTAEAQFRLHENLALKNLQVNQQAKDHAERLKIAVMPETINSWYKMIKSDQASIEQMPSFGESFEKDREYLRYLVRDVMLKNDAFTGYFEEKDMNWAENKLILRALLLKTIKDITETDYEKETLPALSINWDDDKQFFEDLFDHLSKQGKNYMDEIGLVVQKWDTDRITSVDQLLLEMSMCEMLHFPSIPVKVTINEYVEIAKIYGTDRSPQFVNGVMDKVAENLQKEGRIRKSGRGLLDNQ